MRNWLCIRLLNRLLKELGFLTTHLSYFFLHHRTASFVNFALLHFDMLLVHNNMRVFLTKCLLFLILVIVFFLLLRVTHYLHAISLIMALCSVWSTSSWVSMVAAARLPTAWELAISVIIILSVVHFFRVNGYGRNVLVLVGAPMIHRLGSTIIIHNFNKI